MDPSTVRNSGEFALALKALIDQAVREGRIENTRHLARKLGLSRAAVSAWLSTAPRRRGTGMPAPAHLFRLLEALGVADTGPWMAARDRAANHPTIATEPTTPEPAASEGAPFEPAGTTLTRLRSRPLLLLSLAGLVLVAAVAVPLSLRSGGGPEVRPSQPQAVTIAAARSFADCPPAGHACLFGKRDGKGQMIDLGRIQPGQYFDLWKIPLAAPSQDHWGDAVSSVRNLSDHTLCFYVSDQGTLRQLSSEWRPGEETNFHEDNEDKADAVLVVEGVVCPERPNLG